MKLISEFEVELGYNSVVVEVDIVEVRLTRQMYQDFTAWLLSLVLTCSKQTSLELHWSQVPLWLSKGNWQSVVQTFSYTSHFSSGFLSENEEILKFKCVWFLLSYLLIDGGGW